MSEEPEAEVVSSNVVPIIARVPVDDERVSYYQYCSDGRPVFGPKTKAAQLGKMLPMVLRQLQAMCPDYDFEVIGQSVRFSRRKKKEETQ